MKLRASSVHPYHASLGAYQLDFGRGYLATWTVLGTGSKREDSSTLFPSNVDSGTGGFAPSFFALLLARCIPKTYVSRNLYLPYLPTPLNESKEPNYPTLSFEIWTNAYQQDEKTKQKGLSKILVFSLHRYLHLSVGQSEVGPRVHRTWDSEIGKAGNGALRLGTPKPDVGHQHHSSHTSSSRRLTAQVPVPAPGIAPQRMIFVKNGGLLNMHWWSYLFILSQECFEVPAVGVGYGSPGGSAISAGNAEAQLITPELNFEGHPDTSANTALGELMERKAVNQLLLGETKDEVITDFPKKTCGVATHQCAFIKRLFYTLQGMVAEQVLQKGRPQHHHLIPAFTAKTGGWAKAKRPAENEEGGDRGVTIRNRAKPRSRVIVVPRTRERSYQRIRSARGSRAINRSDKQIGVQANENLARKDEVTRSLNPRRLPMLI
ncbi:hypothetical protein M407DRAFT_226068 [Tulasnella calospora MUT 4182]|uniref:Uncharacterized protein n=1 Tax=Tulasnella calospora MUT 4182 TaxID=1051891 RepID=A0A0C3L7X1_9AGAM|nr:hypothetical protein M407DRAFT_226068 [Tulasnella calospora MUT 4182]